MLPQAKFTDASQQYDEDSVFLPITSKVEEKQIEDTQISQALIKLKKKIKHSQIHKVQFVRDPGQKSAAAGI